MGERCPIFGRECCSETPGGFAHLSCHLSLYSVPYHAIAAATCLTLDVFQASSSPSTPAQAHETTLKRNEIRLAVEALRILADTSPIAARGVQLLDSLLLEERKRMLAAAQQQQQHMLLQRSEAAISNVRSQPGTAGHHDGGEGDSSFRTVAHRASLALSDPNGNHSTSPSTAAHPSPAGINPPPTFHLSPNALASDMALDDHSALTQSMLDQILFSGMGAPLGGAETPVYTGAEVEGAESVDFWGMMAGGGGGAEFGAGWVGEEGFGGF